MALQLNIIIPQYQEDEKLIKPLLTSIENQIGISHDVFNVTIVNDHSSCKLSQEFLSSFDFHIDYLETPVNAGAGVTRQYGLDNTDAPYIMFCDADDRLYSADVLLKILNCIRLLEAKKTNWNYLWTDFYEEFRKDKAYDLIIHDKQSMIWMHGKVWKRQFLKDNNIHFHPTLRTYEDTFFGKWVGLLGQPSLGYHLAITSYLWLRNPNSVTANWNHDNKSYLYWHNDDYITCNRDLLKEIRGKTPRWAEVYFTTIAFTYCILQLAEFRDELPETEKKCKNMLMFVQDIINKYIETLNKVDNKYKAQWFNTVRFEFAQRFDFTIEHESWNQWLKQFDSAEILTIK